MLALSIVSKLTKLDHRLIPISTILRYKSTSTSIMTKALVLGVYQIKGKSDVELSPNAVNFDKQVGGKFSKLVSTYGVDKGKAKVFYDLHADYPIVAAVGLGSSTAGFNEVEEINEKPENVRIAIAAGARTVRGESKVDEIVVDDCNCPSAAAEGAHLSLWTYDELKSAKYKKKDVKISVFNESVKDQFALGKDLASAQNICRRLAETPSNMLTPTKFANFIVNLFKDLPQVKVIVHDEAWAESKKMGSFLSVGKGSNEPSKFVEIHYNNKPDSKPYALVGKGVCFDSGGISLKPALNMGQMRYDMSGAANVVSTIYALATLNSKVNVVGLTPLCENMPSGSANKPGDVVFAMNGKSIHIDNTDAEGRLILADALCYADEFDPQAVLDIATLTGAMKIALGSAATGVFASKTSTFEKLKLAAQETGDRVWRFPLYSTYTSQVTDSVLADCFNVGKIPSLGGSCTAAAFLHEFVKCPDWMHLDIAGVMDARDDPPYYGKNMTGRPMRTLVNFLIEHFKQ